MRKIALALAATTALLAGPALQAKVRLTPQERLDKLLEGREAGKPVSCISTFGAREMQILDDTAIVYGRGNVIYVNRPANADALDDDDVMVTRQFGSQLCRMDMVSMHDRTGGWYRGFVNLGEFVPYRRVAASK